MLGTASGGRRRGPAGRRRRRRRPALPADPALGAAQPVRRARRPRGALLVAGRPPPGQPDHVRGGRHLRAGVGQRRQPGADRAGRDWTRRRSGAPSRWSSSARSARSRWPTSSASTAPRTPPTWSPGCRAGSSCGARVVAFSLYVVPLLVVIAGPGRSSLSASRAGSACSLGALVAAYGCGLAVNPVLSVLGAYALPETLQPVRAQHRRRDGQGLLSFAGELIGVGARRADGAAATALLGDVWLWLALPVGLAYGFGARRARQLHRRRRPRPPDAGAAAHDHPAPLTGHELPVSAIEIGRTAVG